MAISETEKWKTLEYRPEEKKFRPDLPLTIGYIRDQVVRKNQYVGDLFEAVRFLLQEYDTVNEKLKVYTRPTEYVINNTYDHQKKLDVV